MKRGTKSDSKQTPAEIVRHRLISVANLIRRSGTPEEAREAAEWEQLLSSNKFNPAKALN